ncbi:MAG: hypothetical protein Kilf2KO_09610 [Rhodospirillales bacterium]
MPTSEDFQTELVTRIDRARRQGCPHVEVNSGELHRIVGSYPGHSHRMTVYCEVMKSMMKSEDSVIFEPKEGKALPSPFGTN